MKLLTFIINVIKLINLFKFPYSLLRIRDLEPLLYACFEFEKLLREKGVEKSFIPTKCY